ncbi:AAA family ATPase [Chitinophaga sp. LS1]|uniref:AAA family ATPase n=1 Tax=Chitinophaga sp. LS1 TaxID=3051176 RepID=UPI002AAA760A|nr:AAA family ATPase [Chitinophaga sp. LS1]WPV70220.1 AAA family ATPase [Chitinophaga sp. LS1]
MRKAFVFGKFMPFHKGHEAMIRFALTKCDFLTVLICVSDQETMPGVLRKSWLDETFRQEQRVEILTYHYDENILPGTSVTSASVSEVWAVAFKELLPDYNILVTSEPYGELVAGFMGITHIPFDPERKIVPVSATMVRNNLWEAWPYLPDSVKKTMMKKVVILGTESTGKTTLTGRLATHFNAAAVMEAGRDIVADSNDFSMHDLYAIATAHAARIKATDAPLLIIDTDIHITISYGEYAFGKKMQIENEIFSINKADLYLYMDNDVPFVQDGTRIDEAARNELDVSHRNVLEKYGIEYEVISGNWEERFEQAVGLINHLVNFRSQGANFSSVTHS